jgi:hypothetical protein
MKKRSHLTHVDSSSQEAEDDDFSVPGPVEEEDSQARREYAEKRFIEYPVHNIFQKSAALSLLTATNAMCSRVVGDGRRIYHLKGTTAHKVSEHGRGWILLILEHRLKIHRFMWRLMTLDDSSVGFLPFLSKASNRGMRGWKR